LESCQSQHLIPLSDFRSEFSKNEPERRSGFKKKNRNAVPVRSGPIRTLILAGRMNLFSHFLLAVFVVITWFILEQILKKY